MPPFVSDMAETVIDYLRLLEIEISRGTMRAAFAAHPELSLATVQQILDQLGIPNAAFAITPADLPKLPPPYLAWLHEPLQEGAGMLAIVARADAVGAEMRTRAAAEFVAWPEFVTRWRGILVVAEPPASPLPGEQVKLALEREAAAAYRASVRILEDFLDREECAAIVRRCTEQNAFARSPLSGRGASGTRAEYVGPSRTSDSAIVTDRTSWPFADIYRRAAALAGLTPDHCEDLQCVRYCRGQEFRPHVDANDGLPRSHTLLVYLNEGFEGGETVFPEIGLRVVPKTGLGVMFRNLDEHLEPIAEACHAALPVLTEIKYACNLWLRRTPVDRGRQGAP